MLPKPYTKFDSNSVMGAPRYYLSDNKNIIALIQSDNTSANKLVSNDYKGYGQSNVVKSEDKGFGYDKEYVDQGLQAVYLRARDYITKNERFLVRDSYVNEWNKYNFADANPIMNIDPSGHKPSKSLITAIAIVGTVSVIMASLFLNNKLSEIIDEYEILKKLGSNIEALSGAKQNLLNIGAVANIALGSGTSAAAMVINQRKKWKSKEYIVGFTGIVLFSLAGVKAMELIICPLKFTLSASSAGVIANLFGAPALASTLVKRYDQNEQSKSKSKSTNAYHTMQAIKI